jgi:hypothetical protein
MKTKCFLFLWILYTTGILNAQTDFRPGYVIKPNNDTLRGEIDYRGDVLMGQVCRFKANGTETKYSPDDIVGYRFYNDKYFVTKEVNGTNVFLEFLIKGRVNVYYRRDDQGDHYFLEKDSIGITEMTYEEGIRYREDGTAYSYKSKRHIGVLNVYMHDAPEFLPRIASMEEPDAAGLIKLAEDYHHRLCKDQSCIVYEKKEPFLKVYLEAMAGVFNYRYGDDYIITTHFQYGVLAHFWLPRANEKLYFRTGILYSTVETQYAKEEIYKIPLQFEYIYPRGVVQPKMAFGINLYKPLYQSVAGMAGVNIRFYRSLFLAIDYDIDFCPSPNFPLFPQSMLSQSILVGLHFKLY